MAKQLYHTTEQLEALVKKHQMGFVSIVTEWQAENRERRGNR